MVQLELGYWEGNKWRGQLHRGYLLLSIPNSDYLSLALPCGSHKLLHEQTTYRRVVV